MKVRRTFFLDFPDGAWYTFVMAKGVVVNGLELGWQRLCLMNPHEVLMRVKVKYEDGGYIIRFLNNDYLIFPYQRRIVSRSSQEKIGFELCLILISYLVSARVLEPSGEWVSPEGLEGGKFFFRGSHKIHTEGLIERFGDDPEGFIEAGSCLDARKATFGDAGIILPALPRIPLACILWEGDEEFPPQIKILFDKTAQEHLALDLLWSLVRVVTKRILSV